MSLNPVGFFFFWNGNPVGLMINQPKLDQLIRLLAPIKPLLSSMDFKDILRLNAEF